jgi:cleavage and polyadenylation specificity factor subunit 1
MLQSRLISGIQHRAGLNPKGFRTVSTAEYHGAKRNILDGNLLSLYLCLGLIEQTEFAKRIGTTAEQIIGDLQKIGEARAAL